ncbi:MAG TPA: PqqD family protein [Polyangiaceae bacterium]|nr:PqqD family protein [Polyangiaceae bacterium]
MNFSISEDVVCEVAEGEAVLLDLKRGVYYSLDPVGSRFWELLRAGSDLATARECLLAEYDVTPDQLGRDLERLVEDLAQRGLLQPGRP